MRLKDFFTNSVFAFRPLLSLLFIVIFTFSGISSSYAKLYDGARDGITYSNGMCHSGSFSFNPYAGNDTNWELDNPTCQAFMIGFGVGLGAVRMATASLCTRAQRIALIAASTAAGAVLSPDMIQEQIDNASSCSTFLSTQNYVQAAGCCGSIAATMASVGITVAALYGVYRTAETAFDNARICGYNWQTWAQTDSYGVEIIPPATIPANAPWKKGKFSGSRWKCLSCLFTNDNASSCNSGCSLTNDSGTTVLQNTVTAINNSDFLLKEISNKPYREFLYGGVETEDKGSGACKNPTTWDSAKRTQYLGYTTDNQRYYMTGPGLPGAYACNRFMTAGTIDAATQAAYDCCKTRSQNSICIAIESANSSDYQFCEMGSRCKLGEVWYDIYASKTVSNYICAKTYSLCPFDHLLGGGTEVKEMSTTNTTQVANYCQYLKHCSKLPILPYVHSGSNGANFISSACFDLKGDSQNSYGYSQQLLPISTRHFSAPMVQCFKETMENLMLNRAGRTLCYDYLNNAQDPDSGGNCPAGTQKYNEGDNIGTESFFAKLQRLLKSSIQMTLVVSVTFFGAMILLGLKPIEKKVLLTYILKIALVMYFAVGTGWQYTFMDKILGISTFLADFAFKPEVASDPAKQDGCQFPRVNYADVNVATKYTNPAYPPGKQYLAVWDTLDCKIAMALGFGPEVSVPNLGIMIAAGFFTGGLGIIFVLSVFIFAFFLIGLTIRAMHIFLMSMTSVVLLIFISPIPIVLAMFAKTKNIFDSWWKQILGLTLQPMILFAYMGIMISIFDNVVVGDANFSGNGRDAPKTIECGNATAAAIMNGATGGMGTGFSGYQHVSSGDSTSIYCIFRVADMQTYDGLEMIGVGVPMLVSMNKDKIITIFKAALIMFIFSTFMDKISTLAAKLIGNDSVLQSTWNVGAGSMTKKAYGTLRSVQQRGMGLSKKVVSGVARSGVETARDISNAAKSLYEGRKNGKPPVVGSSTPKNSGPQVTPGAANPQGMVGKGGGAEGPAAGATPPAPNAVKPNIPSAIDVGGGGAAPDAPDAVPKAPPPPAPRP